MPISLFCGSVKFFLAKHTVGFITSISWSLSYRTTYL